MGNLLHEHKSLHHRILLEAIPAGQEFLKPFVEAIKGGFTYSLITNVSIKIRPNQRKRLRCV